MSQSQVISFRVSGHFLNWIEAQKLDGESINQAAQRILKEVSGTSTASTTTDVRVIPADSPTHMVETIDKVVSSRLEPVIERIVAIEERLRSLNA